MLNPIEINFKLDKTIKRALTTELMIKSHDINVIEFHISFDDLELTADHTVKVLSVFSDTKSQTNVNCDIVDGKAIYRPDTSIISQYEHVLNYVYVYHGNQSLDVRLFTYSADSSEIDKTAIKVKTVYDQSYAELLTEFEARLQDYKDSLPQASDIRAEVDAILDKFKVDSDAKLRQYDAGAQQVIADNQTAFDLAEGGRQSTYEQAEDIRNQASNQAVADWNLTADSLLETVESNESARVDAEATRKTAETDRVSSETTRKTNETTRISNENARKSAEDIRLANEVDRVNAENIRAEFYEGFDGRLGDLESGRVVLKNLVVNGDFRNGSTGWKLVNARHDSENNFTFTGGLGYVYQNIPTRADDKIYIAYNGAMLTEGGTLSVRLAASTRESDFPTTQRVVSSVYDESMAGSVVVNVLDNYEIIAFNSYPSPGASRSVELGLLQVINLTQIFGGGNEPTKAEMDELIKITGYFDEITLTQMQMLNWQLKLMRQNRNALIALGGTII